MLTNVFNSHDANLMKGFFSRYAVPNLLWVKSCLSSSDLDRSEVEIHGPDLIVGYNSVLGQMTPDKTLSMNNIQIKVRSDTSRSELTAQVVIRATRLYAYTLEEVFDYVAIEANRGASSPQSQEISRSRRVLSSSGDDSFDVEGLLRRDPPFPLLPAGRPLEIHTALTLSLNELKQMEKLQFFAHKVLF